MRRILLIALAAVVFAGCASETSNTVSTTATPEGILHLGGKIYTESEYRLKIRTDLADLADDPETETFCRSLQGLSDDDTFMAIMGPSQISLPVTDQLRAAAIYREECARFLGTSQ